MVFVDNKKFYDYLMSTCKEFIEKEPQIKEELEGYLHQIKMELNIWREEGVSLQGFLFTWFYWAIFSEYAPRYNINVLTGFYIK